MSTLLKTRHPETIPGVLPDKLSALLRRSIRDVMTVQESDAYVLDMDTWHCPSTVAMRCLVCMAGSVMACSLGSGPGDSVMPSSFGKYQKHLRAIDWMRQGLLGQAHDAMGHHIYPSPDVCDAFRDALGVFDHRAGHYPFANYLVGAAVLEAHDL